MFDVKDFLEIMCGVSIAPGFGKQFSGSAFDLLTELLTLLTTAVCIAFSYRPGLYERECISG